ncbi:MAG: DUF1549 and DUF1553 domain-containing protein [Gemmataceae bacterium]|nr:DUF1549 and DUF1553 domain-containing protein [Gemmataceae bacterium]
MSRLCLCLMGGLAVLGLSAQANQTEQPAKGVAAPALDARALAAKIDEHLAASWKDAKITPAPLASDSEFLRRVYLDLAGRIPSVAEVRRFREDKRSDKRERIINDLLDGPRYATHFSRVWRALWLPEAATSIQGTFLSPAFESWLRKHLADNTGYDRMVHELITTPMGNRGQIDVFQDVFSGKPSPTPFFLAKEAKPENLAASTSRLFLGVKLECAQCHNHFHADWKREQFWQLAAFFDGIKSQSMMEFTFPSGEDLNKRDIKIPNTETVIPALFLDGSKPQFKNNVGSRTTLADWMTARNNPYFARAAVNRIWSYFFGTAMVEPVDEMIGEIAKNSHPALFEELSKQFVANNFDLKYLMRAITNSQAYQRTSSGKVTDAEALALFARMPLRGLTAEQLYDSVAQTTGYNEPAALFPISFVPGAKPSPRAEFITRFASLSEKATEFHTSILHALALMNGKLITDATSLETSETLSAVANSPFLDTSERIETLYLAALARLPRPEELTRMLRHVEGDRRGAQPTTPTERARYNRALADVFWVLLNSGEFMLNH